VTSALLVLDVQEGVMARYSADDAYLVRLREALDAARAHELTVIFVRVGFRAGFAEISKANRMFSVIAARGGDGFLESAPGTQVVAALGRRDSEPVVVKKRVSAFAGSDLDVLLRSAGVDHLVLAGIATSGVVLSTVRDGADRDYRLTVLEDGCLDSDAEVHAMLVGRIFRGQAEVMTIRDWVDTLVP
jgi:nicotinamidase-related amidase